MRNTLIERKKSLFPETKDMKAYGEQLANFFYCYASNKPMEFGIYIHYYQEQLVELFTHYEDDFKLTIELLNGEHLARLA